MPFLRFSRDKRGYEHTYLVHAANRRGRPTRPRVLYWYRTPPGVKVGRAPFDDEVRKTLESQYPGVTFDWKTFESTPMPPPEPEYWRERRRAERAARQARQLEEAEAQVQEAEAQGPDSPGDAPASEAEAPEFPLRVRHSDVAILPSETATAPEGPLAEGGGSATAVAPAAVDVPPLPRGKRRRRGGRRRHARPASGHGAVPPPGGPETPSKNSDEAARDTQSSDESEPE